MSNSKIKVAGYAKRTFGNGEYRPFSPDLVGVQIASDGGTYLLWVILVLLLIWTQK
jgi:hypothetical protein